MASMTCIGSGQNAIVYPVCAPSRCISRPKLCASGRKRSITSSAIAKLGDVVDGRGHLVVVAVPDRAGLRRAGRAGRVDEREAVLLVDRGLGFGERRRVRRRELAAASAQRVQLGERDHVGETEAGDLLPLALVLDEHADGLGVLEDVLAVLRRAVRVDGRADSADQAEGVVEQRPVERRLREDPERVSLAHAQREEAVRELLHRLLGLAPRDLRPPVRAFDEIGGIRPPGRDAFAPQPSDRPPAAGGALGSAVAVAVVSLRPSA